MDTHLDTERKQVSVTLALALVGVVIALMLAVLEGLKHSEGFPFLHLFLVIVLAIVEGLLIAAFRAEAERTKKEIEG